jgi:hypothetical protein
MSTSPEPRRANAEGGFLRRHGAATAAGLGAVAVIAIGVWLYLSGDNAPPPRRVQEFTIVNVTPPPPPPPPPPEQKIPEETKMVDAPQMTDVKPEEKVETPKETPPDAPADEPPPGPLGLDQTADGPGDSFNLAGKPGGRGLLGGGGGGSAWGYYTTVVTREVESALRSNPKTRNGVGQMQVRIWTDQSGRITRVQLANPSGNAELDGLIRGEALVGLALGSAPPSDMPMPIVTRITMRQPS